MKSLVIALLLFCTQSMVFGQVIIDDFESGNLLNWLVLQGNAETVGNPVSSGAFAARLHRPDLGDASSLAIHTDFEDNWGVYEMKCYADGAVSDIIFLFQYLDGNNYYAVGCNPRNTDNPELHLYRVVDGVFQTLALRPPSFDLNTWFDLRIERYCDGTIRVSIDDQLEIQTNDRSLVDSGTVAMAAWAESSYFDDITFSSVRDREFTDLTENICSGSFFEVAGNRYNRSGMYADTLVGSGGCDSIIRLDLTVHPHFLVSESDTICSDTFYVFGGDTLRQSGRYSTDLISAFSCDSIVELNLMVLGGDTIVEDRTLCAGSFTLFNDDTIRAAGSYFQILTVDAGCTSTFQLDVTIQEPTLDLGEDETVCFGETPTVIREILDFDSVRWSTGSSDLTILIDSPGIYWADAFLGNCMATDTFEIFEECIVDTLPNYYIPNAFSPNGDQVNDFFEVQSAEPLNYSMQIFNRWGNLVFENNGGWDGTSDGEKLPHGVYVYLIEIEGRKFMGDITLLP